MAIHLRHAGCVPTTFGQEPITYIGRQDANSNDLATTKYVQFYGDNAYVKRHGDTMHGDLITRANIQIGDGANPDESFALKFKADVSGTSNTDILGEISFINPSDTTNCGFQYIHKGKNQINIKPRGGSFRHIDFKARSADFDGQVNFNDQALDNIGHGYFRKNVYFQRHGASDSLTRLINKAPQDGDTSKDFPLILDLTDKNTAANRFHIQNNTGYCFQTQGGPNPKFTIDNLKSVDFLSNIDEININTDVEIKNSYLHIFNSNTKPSGSTNNVPFIISRATGDQGSFARFQKDGKDLLKINNDGALERVRGIEFQDQEGATEPVLLKTKCPPNWNKTDDFGLRIDLTDYNTVRNKLIVEGNTGELIHIASGANSYLSFDNLNKLQVKSNIDTFETDCKLEYGNSLLKTKWESVDVLPRNAFDNVFRSGNMKNGQFANLWLDRSNQQNKTEHAIKITCHDHKDGIDMGIYNDQGSRAITIQSGDATSNRAYIQIGENSKPAFSSVISHATTTAQVAAPARMGWYYTSNGTPQAEEMYYNATGMKINFKPKVGAELFHHSGKTWTLTPNTYFTIWEFDYDNLTWMMRKSGHVTKIAYHSSGIWCDHDELVTTGVLQKNTIYYVTIGGFLS